jgi:hypothetical protein
MEYLIEFPGVPTTELAEWYYATSGPYWTLIDASLRIRCGGSGTMYAKGPRRAINDGSLVSYEFQITSIDDYGSDMYQYYPSPGTRCDFHLHIGNSTFGLSAWVYEHYGETDTLRICQIVGTVTDYHYQREVFDEEAICLITYDPVTGLAQAYVEGSLVHSKTYATGQDCWMGIRGIGYTGADNYGQALWLSYIKFTAGNLSSIMYAGVGTTMPMQPLTFASPWDGYMGNGARYDMVYAPQLTDLCPLPVSWTARYTNSDYMFGDGQISTQTVYDKIRYFEIWGHKSGYFYMYMDENTMNGYYPWTVYMEAFNSATGKMEEWRFEMSYYNDGSAHYTMTIVAPDGTEYAAAPRTSRFVSEQWTCVYWEVDEDAETITWFVKNRTYSTYQVSAPFTFEFYRYTKIERIATNLTYMQFGGLGWWFRGYDGPFATGKATMFPSMADSILECTGTQFTEKIFNVFRNSIYNPYLMDDPESLKGMKLTNVDGTGTDMALDSVCVIIDMYKRVFIYMLKEDPAVLVDDLPDIVLAHRSITGHYWELVDIKTAGNEERMYSEQCFAPIVTDLAPSICDYDPEADTSKTMLQVIHEGIVNPLYIRAFKVPGQHQIRVEVTEPMTIYNVILNFILAK